MDNITVETIARLHKDLETDLDLLKININSFFLVINSILVYFLQAGFAFLEAGAVRSKNTTNILIKNLLDSFVSGIAYWLVGYSFAYGDGNTFIGHNKFASSGLVPAEDAELSFWFFQFVFAASAATILSGALAERCEFTAYLIYSSVLSGFIYPVVSHWCWSPGGWLLEGQVYYEDLIEEINGTVSVTTVEYTVAFSDFAGSGAVHVLGGVAALVGAAILGPRLGRFPKKGELPADLRGHSVPLVALGGFILFFGFFSFNGASRGSIAGDNDGAIVSLIVTNTIISGSFGAVSTLFIHMVISRIRGGDANWSLLNTINGTLTGMIASCSGVDHMYPWSAAVIGVVSGFAFIMWSKIITKLKIDDPLNAFAVHAGGGLWGVFAVALFGIDNGIFFHWNKRSFLGLAWQLVGITAIIAWTAGLCGGMFLILKLLNLLRVDPEMEEKGMDIPKHGEPAYPVFSYGHGWGDQADVLKELSQMTEDPLFAGLPENINELVRKASLTIVQRRAQEQGSKSTAGS